MSYQVIHGDSKEELKKLIEQGIQVDSIVTDPPYELGFMGKSWDSTGIAYDVELWKLALQVLKPGGHMLAFGGSRTYHRMATAIEDAGFEIRDQIMWLYGQGFPKSLNISKAIDKMMGQKREVIGYTKNARPNRVGLSSNAMNKQSIGGLITEAQTDPAKEWDGWGSALKPAHEPIVMARKPLSEKNIASNVIKHGTGGINIDGCRVATNKNNERRYDLEPAHGKSIKASPEHKWLMGDNHKLNTDYLKEGRFPANLIHDGSDEVEAEFAKYGERSSGANKPVLTRKRNDIYGKFKHACLTYTEANTGSASRFFYCAKASAKDRQGSKHPTVKPITLMRYLCRLITPPNGTVLDIFAGTGTTGQAALEEGFKCILIEREAEYIADINKRLYKVPMPLKDIHIDEVIHG